MTRARVDENARVLDAEFERLGCSVLRLDGVGEGAPDRLVGWGGVDQLVEYKNRASDYGRRRRANQAGFRDRWRGRVPLVVSTRAEVAVVVERMRTVSERAYDFGGSR